MIFFAPIQLPRIDRITFMHVGPDLQVALSDHWSPRDQAYRYSSLTTYSKSGIARHSYRMDGEDVHFGSHVWSYCESRRQVLVGVTLGYNDVGENALFVISHEGISRIWRYTGKGFFWLKKDAKALWLMHDFNTAGAVPTRTAITIDKEGRFVLGRAKMGH